MAPIQKCPEEVLLMIFDAITERNPILATRLLTVCRRWYDVAVNAPILWNHISVKLGGKSAISTAPEMVTQHITTCLRRSAASLLHIRLELEDLPMEKRERFRHPPGSLEAISSLVGDKSEHMKRWDTAEIVFPGYYGEDEESDYYEVYSMLEPIWRIFCGSAPNLTKLWVKNAHFFRDLLAPEERFTTFLDMGSLKELKVDGNPSDWDFLGLHFESVWVLYLDADTRSHRKMLELSRFTHLRHLSVCFYQQSGVNFFAPATVHLPSLQTLTLQPYWGVQRSTIWNVPVLQMLTVTPYVNILRPKFPNVQALHVCWTKDEWCLPYFIQRHLRNLILQYTEMRKLTVPSSTRSSWESLADELSKEPGARLVEVEFFEEKGMDGSLILFP